MITIFSKDGCPNCERAKQLLENYDIEYTVLNVSQDQEALDFIKSQGHKSVPQFYSGQNMIVNGYNELVKMTREELLERVGE